ncbi:copper homeostasis protein CutC [Natribacillus halophilus]|uniref:PF03932 family protein CutC n=1 Tax=Natribacillus halophilus TaxID=549003 RepID=A0A1G8KDR5_9BACI|nr:copper homeostasis protein CutC [Natribacillus halophilus]SDI41553.1 copper homeostasis protein [Natribacillus halophilus]
MYIEAIVQTPEEAMRAEQIGIDRLELVSGMKEGGLTPSYGTIKHVLQSVSIPVQIMIRPHSYHYAYSNSELETMYEDIRNVVELGGNGIVFGALNQDKTINLAALDNIINISDHLDITVHRAFDEAPSLDEAYKMLSAFKNVQRILTSGGEANCVVGKEKLQQLVKVAEQTEGPKILPGGGLTVDNMKLVKNTVGADQYHFGSGLQIDGDFSKGFDNEKVQWVKRIDG